MSHLHDTLTRAVLFIDKAQGVADYLSSELRLLASAEFDSRQLMSILLAG